MLDDLDDIPWDQLYHAYGTAEDVPDLIRALLSIEERERRRAQEMIYMGVLHQGSICTATPHVATFLAHLLDDPSVPDRAWLLSFLGSALRSAETTIEHLPANRQDYLESCIQYGEMTPETASATFEEELRASVMTRDTILKDIDVYFRAMEDDEPNVRQAAIGLLLHCKEAQAQFQQRVRLLMYIEEDANVLASMLLSVGQMPQADADTISLLNSFTSGQSKPPIAHVAAAFALARVLKADAKPEHFVEPLRLITADVKHLWNLEMYYQLHVDEGSENRLLHWLYGLRGASADMWAAALINWYSSAKSGQAYLRNTFLHLSFVGESVSPATMAYELSDLQCAALRAVVARYDEWGQHNVHSTGDVYKALGEIGIFINRNPTSRDELIAFLDGKRPAHIT